MLFTMTWARCIITTSSLLSVFLCHHLAFSFTPPTATLRRIGQDYSTCSLTQSKLTKSCSSLQVSHGGTGLDDRVRPDIAVIENEQDYVKFLEEDDRPCVIKFYASWCKCCAKYGVMFRKLAFDQGDRLDKDGSICHVGNVRFAEAEYTANSHLCKSLKVKKLPTVHMYRTGSGKVVDLTCKPSEFQQVVGALNRLLISTYEGAEAKGDSHVVVTLFDNVIPIEAETSSFDMNMSDGNQLAEEIMISLRDKEHSERVIDTIKTSG